ncbi:MAG: chemotaxis protein CheD [Bacteroidetes bacterium 4572_128]|nr:MAG: chemotaxis protein CheD [Bacteroidetes bacterium 4572_128]
MKNLNINGNIFLYPSSIFVSKKPNFIITILGSCVSVCLFDFRLKIGGINHFMLPFWNKENLASPRYGDIAIEELIKKMKINGAKRENLKAKLFGGAKVLENMENKNSLKQGKVGMRNITIARKILKEEKISIIGSSTGGYYGRKIIFNTNTGEVRMKFIKKSF